MRLLRVGQWTKNLFVFLPLFFGGGMLVLPRLLGAVLAFLLFSLMSSGIYIVNDVSDLETDRLHPVKCRRPLASGRVGVGAALCVAVVLAAAALCGAWLLLPGAPGVVRVIAAYLVLNLLYTWWLKHLPIIDVMVIALGFVLRVYAGGYAAGIAVSPWLAVMTFLLTLFVAFGKRRDDLRVAAEMGASRSDSPTSAAAPLRRSVAGYTPLFVDTAMALLSAALVIAYIIYTLTPEVMMRFHSQYVFITTIFVIAGMLRYLQQALRAGGTGQPDEMVFKDPFLLWCVVGWLASFIIIIYL